MLFRSPRDSKEGIFHGGVAYDILYQGILVSILTVLAYLLGHVLEGGAWKFENSDDGMSMAFLTMSMAEIFHSYNMRSQRGSIFKMKTHNVWLFGAMALALVLTTAVIEIPFFAKLFDFTVIGWSEYAIALGLSILIVPIVEIVKLIQRSVKK